MLKPKSDTLPATLPVTLPELAEENCYYYMLPPGPMHLADSGGLEMEVVFQAVHITSTSLKPIGDIVQRTVGTVHLGNLRAGTLWNSTGKLIADYHQLRNSLRVVQLPNEPLPAKQIKDIIPIDEWITHFPALSPNTQVNVLVKDNTTVLLPCFEMLRAFYFEESAKILAFLFSQLSISSLARVIIYPTESNSHRARICIAAKHLGTSAVRVIAELLINPNYYHTLRHALNQLFISRKNNINDFYINALFNFDKLIDIQIGGKEFVINNKKYLLAESVLPATNYYSFDKLFYHMLTPCNDAQAAIITQKIRIGVTPKLDLQNTDLIKECSDISALFLNKRRTEFNLPATQLSTDIWPATVLMEPWAKLRDSNKSLIYIDQASCAPCLLNSYYYDKDSIKFMRKLIAVLKKSGYHSSYLLINNQDSKLGLGLSLLNDNLSTTLYGPEFYDYLKLVGLAEITYAGYFIYLAQALNAPYPIMAWHATGLPLRKEVVLNFSGTVHSAGEHTYLARRIKGYSYDRLVYLPCDYIDGAHNVTSIKGVVSYIKTLMDIFIEQKAIRNDRLSHLRYYTDENPL
ncbi:MAG: hypothetical protein EOO61_02970 [Hymenobacter sp.]|nr:MAG: hypothetical protein EOO61_02970 [Hymenobacter sp.]